MIIHIAGFPVKVGTKVRQLCAWCGEALQDADLRNIAVAPKADGSPGDSFTPWETGVLVAVNGSHSWVEPHKDGDPIPKECCAPWKGTPEPEAPGWRTADSWPRA